ncbi:hypothetical protein E2P81_ATG03853 [Venturia nashicola]|nr:hypothetical protein E2P81_ATG03853 [Venturia nashicola]
MRSSILQLMFFLCIAPTAVTAEDECPGTIVGLCCTLIVKTVRPQSYGGIGCVYPDPNDFKETDCDFLGGRIAACCETFDGQKVPGSKGTGARCTGFF